jgi:hypothetical protein
MRRSFAEVLRRMLTRVAGERISAAQAETELRVSAALTQRRTRATCAENDH